MTYIDVGDDNSAPEQNMVRADRGWSRTPTGFLSLADSPPPMRCEAFVSPLRSGPFLHRLPVIRSLRAAPGVVRCSGIFTPC